MYYMNLCRKAVHTDRGRKTGKRKGRGKEVKVAVLDSGVSVTEDLEIEERANLVDEGEISYLCEDMTGHGTAVAGVIAAFERSRVYGYEFNY